MRRRAVLASGAALALLGRSCPAPAATPTRIVALEWSIVSMLLSLGIAPVGMPEIAAYAHWVAEPAVPATVRDIGIKTEPNLEAVTALSPDLILTSPLNRAIGSILATIAPVREVPIYTEARAPVRMAADGLGDLGTLLGRADDARREIAATYDTFSEIRQQLSGLRSRRVLLVAFLDNQHVRVFGQGSLFADVLARVGLENAWKDPVNVWGFSLVGIADLASVRDTSILVLEPTPPGVAESLRRPGLWSSLPAVRGGQTATVKTAWQYGDLVAARRFAGFLPAALRELR